MNYEEGGAILFRLFAFPLSVPSTTKVDGKWTVRSDFDTHHFCPLKTNGRFAPPKLSVPHLGANGRSHPNEGRVQLPAICLGALVTMRKRHS